MELIFWCRDDRTMHEVYQWPFAASVHAGVGSVMCSYNRVNQTHSCENSKVVNGLTKEELNFQGQSAQSSVRAVPIVDTRGTQVLSPPTGLLSTTKVSVALWPAQI